METSGGHTTANERTLNPEDSDLANRSVCACAAGGDSGLGTAGVLAGSTDNLVGMDLLISPPHTSALPTSSAGDLGTDALPSLPRNFSHTALSGLEHMFDTDVAPHQDHGLFDNLDLGPLGQT